MLQVTNVLAQVEVGDVRLLNIIVVNIHLFTIVLQLD